MDLWYGVYLAGGKSHTGETFARIAWFYTKKDIQRVLPKRSFPDIYLRYKIVSNIFI